MEDGHATNCEGNKSEKEMPPGTRPSYLTV